MFIAHLTFKKICVKLHIRKDRWDSMGRKVAIYARVSTEHETQLSALENQIQYYDNIMAQHPDWTLYNKYIDEGITGTSIKKRKNFMKMMEDAQDGCFDLIVTREVSRFARNTVDTLQETRKLKKMGVEVFFVEDNIWTLNDEDGELKLTIMATLAQNESKKISQRVKAGQKITFQNGVFYGTGNILGYDRVGKDMVVNEKQAEIVKYIFSSFLEGKGTSEIKYDLEKKEYLTSTGKKVWHASYIARVLQNPFYCGTIVYNKAYIPDYLEQKAKINRGEVDQIIVEGRHVPLVSKEDFEKVQKILKLHSGPINNTKKQGKKTGIGSPKSVWGKKMVCECGSSFNKRLYHKATETKPETYGYQCYNQKNNGSYSQRLKKGLDPTGACDIPYVTEWKLRVMAEALFDLLYNNREEILDIANSILEETIKDNKYEDDLKNEIEGLERKISNTKDKTKVLLDSFLNGIVKQDLYQEKNDELENDIKNYNEQISDLKSQLGIPKETVKERINEFKESLKKYALNREEKYTCELVEIFIDKITVHKESFAWKLNIVSDIINMQVANKRKSSIIEIIANRDNLTAEVNCCTSRN